ncbi:MAG: hypothetical protein ACI80V_000719 [Rhodothermales bacterium]|jgi:hypothetical protein
MNFPDCMLDSWTPAAGRFFSRVRFMILLVTASALIQGCTPDTSEDEKPEDAPAWIGVAENMVYIKALPASLADANRLAHEYWNTGIARQMAAGNQILSEFLVATVVRTAAFYPDGHFGEEGLEAHLTDYLNERRAYHESALVEEGMGGTDLDLMIGGAVNEDLEAMVARQVAELARGSTDFDFAVWEAQWVQVE